MIHPQLLNFIKQQLQKGVSRETIHVDLIGSDWKLGEIEEVFSAIDKENALELCASDSLDDNSSREVNKQKMFPNKWIVVNLLIESIFILGVFSLYLYGEFGKFDGYKSYGIFYIFIFLGVILFAFSIKGFFSSDRKIYCLKINNQQIPMVLKIHKILSSIIVYAVTSLLCLLITLTFFEILFKISFFDIKSVIYPLYIIYFTAFMYFNFRKKY